MLFGHNWEEYNRNYDIQNDSTFQELNPEQMFPTIYELQKEIVHNIDNVEDLISVYNTGKWAQKLLNDPEILFELTERHKLKSSASFKDFVEQYDKKYVTPRCFKYRYDKRECVYNAAYEGKSDLMFYFLEKLHNKNIDYQRLAESSARGSQITFPQVLKFIESLNIIPNYKELLIKSILGNQQKNFQKILQTDLNIRPSVDTLMLAMTHIKDINFYNMVYEWVRTWYPYISFKIADYTSLINNWDILDKILSENTDVFYEAIVGNLIRKNNIETLLKLESKYGVHFDDSTHRKILIFFSEHYPNLTETYLDKYHTHIVGTNSALIQAIIKFADSSLLKKYLYYYPLNSNTYTGVLTRLLDNDQPHLFYKLFESIPDKRFLNYDKLITHPFVRWNPNMLKYINKYSSEK
jgi:hypothetical protein